LTLLRRLLGHAELRSGKGNKSCGKDRARTNRLRTTGPSDGAAANTHNLKSFLGTGSLTHRSGSPGRRRLDPPSQRT
jgi:hypothetical protein